MIVFLLLIVGIYYFSRLAIREIFFTLRRIFRNDRLVLSLVSIILLPGTVIHELSHFLMALSLMLPVRSISIFPVFYENEIKLGEVKFGKRGFLRSGLVGVAPLFIGILSLAAVFYFKVFPSHDLVLNIILSYLIFSVSSNMFSSSQDLKDAIFIVPLMLFIIALFYLFDVRLDMNSVNVIMNEIDYYLFFVLAINVFSFLTLKTINTITSR